MIITAKLPHDQEEHICDGPRPSCRLSPHLTTRGK